MPRISFSWNGKKHEDYLRLAENINSKRQTDEFFCKGSYKNTTWHRGGKKRSIANVYWTDLSNSEKNPLLH